MDWKLVMTAFASVFVAELGDKTQIATMAMSGASPSALQRVAVFTGASAALILTSAIAVLLGEVVSRHLHPRWITGIAGVTFLVIGTLYVKRALG